MTRWISVLVFLVACGSDDDGGADVDGGNNDQRLSCSAVSYCTTWSANDDVEITPPAERGGTIADGIYRLERGTFSVELLQFAGNQVNQINDSFYNSNGTYTTTDGLISFSYTTRCDAEGSEASASTWENRPYYANGDTLLVGMADSGSRVIWYEYKKIAVNQICTESQNVECNTTNCSCAVVTDGFGTVENGIKFCSGR